MSADPNQPRRTNVTEEQEYPLNEAFVEGSVIEQTVKLVDEYTKPTIERVALEGGETALVQLSNDEGVTVLDPDLFDDWRNAPLSVRGKATLLDLDSLIQHIERFKQGGVSIVFADNNRSKPSFTAIYDYRTIDAPSFGRHSAQFDVPLSDEWKAWKANDSESLSMPTFARFLEDHIIDVMPAGMINLTGEQQQFVDSLGGNKRIADPAKLIELSTGLQVFEEGEVSQATKLQSGESQITVTNRHTDGAGAELRIPSMFVIAIPVFTNGPVYQMLVRLRYRKTNQGIVFFYEMWRTDRVFDHAFDEAVKRVGDETGLPVLLGREG
jgi:uncharacterized protein YfdQ (DUF2303 family)